MCSLTQIATIALTQALSFPLDTGVIKRLARVEVLEAIELLAAARSARPSIHDLEVGVANTR